MSIFQRIRTPFSETAEETDLPAPRRHSAVGELLRARREQLELDLDYIGEALRIRPAYLAALEQGRIEELPGPAYAMGFVRAYANHLGLDGDRVLARYKADTADVHTRPDLALPVPLGERSLPGGPILLVALILALCGYGTWYYLSTDERARPERVAAVPAELRDPATTTPTAPPAPASQPAAKTAIPPAPEAEAPKPGAAPASPGEQRPLAEPAAADATAPPVSPKPAATVPTPTLSTARPGVAAAPDPIVFPGSPPPQGAAAAQPGLPPQPMASATATPTPAGVVTRDVPTQASAATAVAPGAEGRVALRALADCWIQVRATDQSVVFSRVLKTGETYHVPARSGLSLRTGNAGALAIEVDGKLAPSIGALGALRRNVALDPDALAAGTAVHG